MRSLGLIVSLSLAQVAFSFNCSIPPTYVDIHKRTVNTPADHGSEVFQYGAFVGYGTPAQNFSLWPSFTHNETTFAAGDFCTDESSANCVDNTHGTYLPELSNS